MTQQSPLVGKPFIFKAPDSGPGMLNRISKTPWVFPPPYASARKAKH